MSSVFGRLLRPSALSFVVPADSVSGLSGATTAPPPTLQHSSLERRLFYVLAAAALIYAFLAGLRTIKDYDLGWQMATGRWVLQHHHAPPVEAFSYIAQGNWIYPVGAGVIFYLAYLLGGFALISWMGAAACCGTVALLLRRGSAVSAAIAIIAVPLIAWRTAPRADMFTVVLFAAFLSLLWENYETGRARLWLLPLLMVAWVNLHLGFSAGLALVGMYVVTELLESLFGAERRRAALDRLRRVYPWLLATGVATLVNPWGWDVYRALIRQERVVPMHQTWFREWQSLPLSWNIVYSLPLRDPAAMIYVLLVIAVVAGGIALLRDRPGAGLMLLGATVPAVRYVRMDGVFSCVVVVVGGYVIAEVLPQFALWIKQPRVRSIVATTLAGLLVLLTFVRCFDLVTNRYYLRTAEESTFGAGLGWWFPQRAAEFIEREKLPGEVFNTYTLGGYISWRLGPGRRDYIDGRGIPFGLERIGREIQLRQSPPDSDLWQQEVSRHNINTVILPIGRYQGNQFIRLPDFCSSKIWALVYMDEVAAVFVRRAPENEALIERFPLNCATAPLPAQAPGNNRAEAFNAWSNAASVLEALGRNSEALAATDKGLAIFPDSPFLHWTRAKLLFAEGRLDESEQEYLAAIALNPVEATWDSLAQSYAKRGRMTAAVDAEEHAAHYSLAPWSRLITVGYLYLDMGQPDNALAAFDRADRSAFWNLRPSDNGKYEFEMAQGRANAWAKLGELEKATAYQEQAANLKADDPQPWEQLANLYAREGRIAEANRARAHAAALEATQNH
ncbi:MAG: tetratricopeptide repeat protein [Candidatus Korobacteraceae bacterium]